MHKTFNSVNHYRCEFMINYLILNYNDDISQAKVPLHDSVVSVTLNAYSHLQIVIRP